MSTPQARQLRSTSNDDVTVSERAWSILVSVLGPAPYAMHARKVQYDEEVSLLPPFDERSPDVRGDRCDAHWVKMDQRWRVLEHLRDCIALPHAKRHGSSRHCSDLSADCNCGGDACADLTSPPFLHLATVLRRTEQRVVGLWGRRRLADRDGISNRPHVCRSRCRRVHRTDALAAKALPTILA